MKKKRMDYYKDFSLFLAITVLVFIAGCSGVTPSDPMINSFSASPSTITAGESSTLSWNVTDATSVTIDPDIGSVALTGTTTVDPATTTTYTLTASNASGSVSATTTVTVGSALTVTYDGNGNTGGTVPIDNNAYEVGDQVIIIGNSGNLEKTGYTFGGWNTASDQSGTDYAPGEIMLMPASNVTLYAKWTPYALRDTGPAGGLIFYVKEGGYSDGWMYLEAAPASTEWTDKQWGRYGTYTYETEKDIGTGQSNTDIIVAWLDDNTDDTNGDVTNKTDRAAYLCDTLTSGGYSDWFLPSQDELNLMYENLKLFGLGGFADGAYWSSSEATTVMARMQVFSSGYQGNNFKYSGRQVRAVRAF